MTMVVSKTMRLSKAGQEGFGNAEGSIGSICARPGRLSHRPHGGPTSVPAVRGRRISKSPESATCWLCECLDGMG